MLEEVKEPPISKLPQSDSEEDRDITTARRASGEKTNEYGFTDNKENIDDQESEEKEPRRAKSTTGKESKCEVKHLVRYLKTHRDSNHRIRSQSDTGCHCDVQGVMMRGSVSAQKKQREASG